MAKEFKVIDALQYNNWSEDIFSQMNRAGIAAAHVTICYHEDFKQTVDNIIAWNRWFEQFPNLIVRGNTYKNICFAKENKRTAIIFGAQNCSPIENNIGLVEICYELGIRFMQLSYNNQSLLASGCYEMFDTGITRMGRQVIQEMNRVGMVIDMSHSAEQSTLEAIKHSKRPIAITHANPTFWHSARRNKSETVLKALAESEGMLGLSLYPHHLRNNSNCTLEDFCTMVAKTVELMGIERIGFGSDLCQNQPDYIVEWMRNGTWTRETDFGEGSKEDAGFPKQPHWFRSNLGFKNILRGLRNVGFSREEIELIAGRNWLNFFQHSFCPKI